MSRRMALSTDEELGKRDDDWKPRHAGGQAQYWPWRWRKRRLLIVLAVVLMLWGVHYIPAGFGIAYRPLLESTAEKVYEGYDAVRVREPTGAPPRDADADDDTSSQHYYNGIVRFYRLGATLQKLSRTVGAYSQQHNVLFAASSLKSMANLIPMACEMASANTNHAHFALFGRSALALDEILELNGVDNATCGVYWHDARGDYAEHSSDARAESSVRGAMKHINEYMHPQAVITDDSAKEDAFFTKAMRSKTGELGKPLIEIPRGRYEQWLWLTKLDASSLIHWHKPTVDIVIQAPHDSSGSLIRLLQSLTNADYSGLRRPRLIIELPSQVETFLGKYLENFNWPTGRKPSEPSLMTLRHRVPSSRISSETASLRFVESFYPNKKLDHYMLILSPQAELSPLFLQYLQYTILQYRYGAFGSANSDSLLGISLDVPTTFLDGKDGLTLPTVSDMSYGKFQDEGDVQMSDATPFLYQAPSSAATLIFGDRWMEFHDFLAKRTLASHTSKAAITKKFVSETEPAWTEYLLELMWARNWFVLHPSSSLVTIHNELAQVPEEFLRPAAGDKPSEKTDQASHPEEEPYLLSQEPLALVDHVEADPTRNLMPLHHMLPFSGELQEIDQLPCVSYDGSFSQFYSLMDQQENYVTAFRKSFGGCEGENATRARLVQDLKTDDLFCLPGQEIKFADETISGSYDDESIAQVIVDGEALDEEDGNYSTDESPEAEPSDSTSESAGPGGDQG